MPLNTGEKLSTSELREKLRLKTHDARVERENFQARLDGFIAKRHALMIGNDCLRHMTYRALNMSTTMNAEIFSEKPRASRISMSRIPLTTSIIKNDLDCFKFGKRMSKQEYRRILTEKVKEDKEMELKEIIKEKEYQLKETEKRNNIYLHYQVLADSYKARCHAAKHVYRDLEKIMAELDKNKSDCPCAVKELEHKIWERKVELEDFQKLREKAKRLLQEEKNQVKPLNKDVHHTTIHFEKEIEKAKTEIEERKKTPLSKFLRERELHAFNYQQGGNIEETKMSLRDRSLLNAADDLIKLMDAVMVSDVGKVIDCLMEQTDVTQCLQKERALKVAENQRLQADYNRLIRVLDFLHYNNKRQHRLGAAITKAKVDQIAERKRFEQLENTRSDQDRLLSSIGTGLNAIFEKMHGAKEPDIKYRWDLVSDIESTINKVKRIKELVAAGGTYKVNRVKPTMLHLFLEKRVPEGSCRVDTQKTYDTALTTFDSFVQDQPGFVSREAMHQRSTDIVSLALKKKGNK